MNKRMIAGRYRILDMLGSGGMGKVYRVSDTLVHRTVALKTLVNGNPERFRIEAMAMARLNHENIIRIFDIGVDGNIHYLTMELIQGTNLKTALREQKFDLQRKIEIFISIGDAIHYAHSQGIIHRDLKPGNIMLTDQGKVCIMDFGLARVLGENHNLSRTGNVIGTPFYMSPEQAQGKKRLIDARSDVYSLGVILYRMLTGHLPFTSKNFTELLAEISEMPPPLPSKYNKEITVDLQNICLKALEKSRTKRYQSAAALVEDLLRYTRGEAVVATSTRAQQIFWYKIKANRQKIKAALLMSLFIFVAGLLVLLYNSTERHKKIKVLLQKVDFLANDLPTAQQLQGKKSSLKLIHQNLNRYMEIRQILDQALYISPQDRKFAQTII